MSYLNGLTLRENQRQRSTLNLIASENYPSPAVLSLLGSVWSTKYAEGYPGKRYYAGNTGVDELETYVMKRALEVFDPTGEYGVNVQVLSGSPANLMVYLTVLKPGETVMSLKLSDGGHLSHLHDTSPYLAFYQHETYNVTRTDAGLTLDLDDYKQQLAKLKPRLVILGFSAYPASFQFAPFIQAAHEAGALVLADIAHISGLVAAGVHDSPFKAGSDGADFVTMTTHKTLRGPRSAMIFTRPDWTENVNKTVFPGTSGGPHLHQIAAVGQALDEVLGNESYPDGRSFNDYITAVLTTCHELERGLVAGGLKVVTPTATHLTLVTLPPGADSLELQRRLEACGAITNRNQVPGDTKSAWRPSGLRLGTAALASRGLTGSQAYELGQTLAKLIMGRTNEASMRAFIDELVAQLPWYY